MLRSKPTAAKESGFTLTELVITMLGVVILTVIGLPLIGTLMSGYRLTMAAQTIMGQLQSARMKAVAGNETFRLNFPAGQSVFQLEDSAGAVVSGPFSLPTGITWNADSGSAITFNSNYVSFLPTGNVPATGAGGAGRCKIKNAAGSKIDLVVSNGGIIRQTPTYTVNADF
jgi:Tfp pilus assembly protein FimT